MLKLHQRRLGLGIEGNMVVLTLHKLPPKEFTQYYIEAGTKYCRQYADQFSIASNLGFTCANDHYKEGGGIGYQRGGPHA